LRGQALPIGLGGLLTARWTRLGSWAAVETKLQSLPRSSVWGRREKAFKGQHYSPFVITFLYPCRDGVSRNFDVGISDYHFKTRKEPCPRWIVCHCVLRLCLAGSGIGLRWIGDSDGGAKVDALVSKGMVLPSRASVRKAFGTSTSRSTTARRVRKGSAWMPRPRCPVGCAKCRLGLRA
jgi:hypothetical protein